MMLDYFYGQSGELFAYFRIPKALFQDSRFRQLSTDARTLYGILLDRMSLSAKNSWVDEHGRVYIIYTVREVQESLCCAEHKAVKLFRELEQADLIERKRRGLGRPSLMDDTQNAPSVSQAKRIKELAQKGQFTSDAVVAIMGEEKKGELDTVTIKNDILRKYFPRSYTPRQMEEKIIQLLDAWQKKRQRGNER